MPTKTGYWIRVKNGQVKDVWDYKPSDDKLASESGWREAVEDHA
jgi:ribosome modulation factor